MSAAPKAQPRPKKAPKKPTPASDNTSSAGSTDSPTSIPEPAVMCSVCCDDIQLYAVGPCNHRAMCHLCSLRMRALSDHTYCVMCRHDCETVVFTKDATSAFPDLPVEGKPFDKKLKIYYASTAIFKEVQDLFRASCQICISNNEKDTQHFPNMRLLKEHLKKEHEMFLCELCLSHLKIFLSEQKLYTRKDLAKHRMFGDAGSSSFKGHPVCAFCKLHFYGDEELFVHLRDKHFRCDICLRDDPTSQHVYYPDYPELKRHFEKEHIMCEDEECEAKKFVVFATEIDYKAHVAEEHTAGMSNAAKRHARRLDLAFDYGHRPDPVDKCVPCC